MISLAVKVMRLATSSQIIFNFMSYTITFTDALKEFLSTLQYKGAGSKEIS